MQEWFSIHGQVQLVSNNYLCTLIAWKIYNIKSNNFTENQLTHDRYVTV
jgi:hypothetical protein